MPAVDACPAARRRLEALREEGRALAAGVRATPLWLQVSFEDVRFRYRRTYLGPLWLTLSMAFLMLTLGLLYSGFFDVETRIYLPYVGVSLISWTLIAGIVNESAVTLGQNGHLIKNTPLPIAVFALRVVAHNLVIFAHNIAIVPFVYLAWPDYLNWHLLLFVPGMALFALNAVPVAIALSLLGGRFRDVTQIVTNLMVVAFFLTPVFWTPELAGARAFVVDWNPFYHVLELLRRPVLGQAPAPGSWVVVTASAAFWWAVAYNLSRRYRRSIVYFV